MAMEPQGIILGQEAARQLAEMRTWFYRNYRNYPPPTRRQPVIYGAADTFPAVIYDRVSIEIPQDALDPIMFEQCAPRLLPLYMGSYSWFEVEPDVAPDDAEWLGIWKVKENGRFGDGGKCDGAIELNRSNAAIEKLRMIVEMHIGPPFDNTNCPSSDNISSSQEYWLSSEEVQSTQIRYWFNLNVPREDCAIPYVVTSSPFNDFPP